MSPETPSFNQLSQQIDAGHKNMTVLVERSGNKISTGSYTGEKLSNGQYVVEVTASNGEKGYRTVPAEALSDDAQANLAETLATDRSMNIDAVRNAAEANDAVYDDEQQPSAEHGVEDGEILASTEQVKNLQAKSERFVRDNAPLLEGMLQGERQLMGAIDQGQDTIKHFKYGKIQKPQAIAQLRETIDHVSQLVRHQGEAVEGHLVREARDLVAEVEETISAVSRDAQEHEIDDDVKLIVKHTESASEEIRGAVRAMDTGRDERGQAIRRLSTLVDELEHDSWGSETIAAQIGKVFSDLEEATGYQYRGLGRIEAECDNLRRLQSL